MLNVEETWRKQQQTRHRHNQIIKFLQVNQAELISHTDDVIAAFQVTPFLKGPHLAFLLLRC